RDGACDLLHGDDRWWAAAQDDVRSLCDQLRGAFAEPVRVAQTPAIVDAHVATVDPAVGLKPLHECRCASLAFRITRRQGAQEETDPPHPFTLLPPRPNRPHRRRAAEEGEEAAAVYGLALHSITSSARSRIEVGTSRPSALAVFILSTVSYFVGNCTGRSPGLAPR